MAYITAARVAEIRKQITSEFPEFRFSIVCDNHSGVTISITESPIYLGVGHRQLNVYHLQDEFKKNPEGYKVAARIYEIAAEGTKWYETGDYGTQPSHYVYINIGQWNKDYKIVARNAKGKPVFGVICKETKKMFSVDHSDPVTLETLVAVNSEEGCDPLTRLEIDLLKNMGRGQIVMIGMVDVKRTA